jgi:hypothetical protein
MNDEHVMLRCDAHAVPCLVLDAMSVSSVSVGGDTAVDDDRAPAGVSESERFWQRRGVVGDATKTVE